MSGTYDDMINLPRPISKKHRPMARGNRAAQFSPFAALSGFDGAIRETDRQTEEKRELSGDRMAELDGIMEGLRGKRGIQPWIQVTYFQKDAKKEGGAYRRTAGRFRGVDEERRELLLADGRRIPLEDVFWLEEDDGTIGKYD
ncbi:hypothetical protein H9X85_09405 [Anaerotignum lactatifermentans]|uniref:YolD-like family protein n=1 Tax=Anaerotignum lactatifermentans TaxID=160404 RepID=A0ABS2G6U2_9FIRM|nr:hypothetical protein [Anaerotignum lactatifermentans]MBM6829763.1 hypothetical protein [Anaerotignum lactatifermentans]MBM6877184.1 hypothetical protein [Anaerotignum lactatifermentans]MBM6951422.1 hypothetical protein [Anaerotignum lactatifermentans]